MIADDAVGADRAARTRALRDDEVAGCSSGLELLRRRGRDAGESRWEAGEVLDGVGDGIEPAAGLHVPGVPFGKRVFPARVHAERLQAGALHQDLPEFAAGYLGIVARGPAVELDFLRR